MTTRREAGICLALLVVIIAFGATVRALTLADWPLSFDEVSTLRGTRAGPVDTLRWLHHYEHPPLSYILVRGVIELSGSTAEWVLRMPSFIAGVLCIPAFYLLGMAIHSPRLGVALAALGAVDPILVSQARQARMYSLLALCVILLLAATALLLRRRTTSPWAWLAWSGLLAACFWSHTLGLAVWVAVAAAMLLWAVGLRLRGRPLPRGVFGGAAIGFLFAIAVSHIGLANLASRVVHTFGNAARGTEAVRAGEETLATLGMVFSTPALGALQLVLAGIGAAVLVRRQPPLGLLVVLLGIAGTAAVALARTDHHTMDPRYFVLLSLACTVTAGALTLLPHVRAVRLAASLGVAVLLVAGAWQALHPRMAEYHEVASLARLASQLAQPGDRVRFHHPVSTRLAEYYRLPRGAFDPRPGRRTFMVVSYIAKEERPALADHVAALAPGPVSRSLLFAELSMHRALLLRFEPEGVAVRGPSEPDWRPLQ